MGPFIVVNINSMAQTIDVRIYGRVVSSYATDGMIISLAHYLARISRYVTPHPDDVVWLGCDTATRPAL